MNSWKVILATIVIFGAGVITGGLLVDHVQHRPRRAEPYAQADNLPPGANPEFLKKQFVQKLNEQLDLTSGQSNRIQQIIAQGQQNTRNLWKIVAPQFQVVWRDTRQQIRDVLTPEQLKKYEQLMRQHPFRRALATNAPPAHVMPPDKNPPPVEPALTNGPI